MQSDVTVREMMDREYVGVSEADSLVETAELLLRENAGAAVVQRGSEHVGVVSQRDILALLVDGPDPEAAAVGDAMTESVPTIDPGSSLESAADRLATQSSGRLLVTNGTEPLGFITERDLLATRTHQPGEAGATTPEAEAVNAAMHDAETAAEVDEPFEEQGICEVCGTLTHDLSSFNGQLLCADCRSM
jgi:CBS domain-containing protein